MWWTHLFKLALIENHSVFYYSEFILSIYLGIFIIPFTSYYTSYFSVPVIPAVLLTCFIYFLIHCLHMSFLKIFRYLFGFFLKCYMNKFD